MSDFARAARVVVGVVLLVGVGAGGAFADESPAAPPPPPPSAMFPVMLPDEAPAADGAPVADEAPAADEALEAPRPALSPYDICPPPVCDPAPCLIKSSTCCWPRDDCGWALGPCGGRIGRTEIAVEGTFTLFEDMDGLLGEAVPAGSNGLSWSPNGYDGEFGGRVTLRHAWTPQDKVEARGIWYGDFAASSTQTGVIGFSPPAGGVTPVTNNARFFNESEAVSLEVNWWHELGCEGTLRFSTVLGLRYLSLKERARADFTLGAAAPIPAFAAADVDTGLLAGQIGGRVDWLLGRLEVGLTGKALLGSMRTEVDVSDASVFVGGPHAAAQDETKFGFGAEVEVSLLHRLTRNLALTAGYTLLFVNDVVRANDAMDFSQAATGAVQVNLDRSALLIHTFTVGFVFSF